MQSAGRRAAPRRRTRGGPLAALGLALLACAGAPQGPALSALPAIAPGMSRLVLYRITASDAPGFHPMLSVDGGPVGSLRPGRFLAVERSPGLHRVTVVPQPSLAAFGNQPDTPPVDLVLEPGTTSYVQVTVVALPMEVVTSLAAEPSDDGARDVAPLEEELAP